MTKKDTYFSSTLQHMTVRVSGDSARVYDDKSGKQWSMSKRDGSWSCRAGDDKHKVALRMVQYVEDVLLRESGLSNKDKEVSHERSL